MKTEKRRHTFRVVLNGTNVNPYHRFFLEMNPFPQSPQYEHRHLCRKLNELAAGPIRDVDHLRAMLEGGDPAFVEQCCSLFIPGQKVEFDIYFDE